MTAMTATTISPRTAGPRMPITLPRGAIAAPTAGTARARLR
jgi:hypothetical protein